MKGVASPPAPEADLSSLSVPRLIERVGRLYAKAWLSDDFEQYVPTTFCFKIVQHVAYVHSGRSWSEAHMLWSKASTEDKISHATKWANYPETAVWHRRVASTYLMLDMHGKALFHYEMALKLDNNSVETLGRIAYCLTKDKRYEEALHKAIECANLEEASIDNGTMQGLALKSSKWRLYKDFFLIAQCYYQTGKIAESLQYFRKAIKAATETTLNADEYFEPELGYLEVLAAESRHDELLELLHDLSMQTKTSKYGDNRLVDLLLHQCSRPLVLNWLPRSACKADQAGFLLDYLETAIDVASQLRSPLKALYLRLAIGATWVFSNSAIDAIAVFEQISLLEYRPRSNIATRQAHAISFQKLATLYKEQILHIGWDSPEAAEWIYKLERIHAIQAEHQNADMPTNMLGSDVDLASIFLAMFYRLQGRLEEAQALLRTLILESFAILSDEEPDNDGFALDNLVRLFIAADDTDSAIALSQSMRNLNLELDLTLDDSPTVQRVEPKLPEITSSRQACSQCLDNIPNSHAFVLCQFCVEPYCNSCLETCIKQPDGGVDRFKPEVICRSDHKWFIIPPLNIQLHTGKILLTDGQIQEFQDWKEKLQRKWMG